MLLETWNPWDPLANTAKKYVFQKISYDSTGLKLVFYNQNNSTQKIQFNFKHSVVFYACADESFRLATICSIANKTITFFKVENSNNLELLKKESLEHLKKTQLIHYGFLEYNYVIDVIANEAPLVEWI